MSDNNEIDINIGVLAFNYMFQVCSLVLNLSVKAYERRCIVVKEHVLLLQFLVEHNTAMCTIEGNQCITRSTDMIAMTNTVDIGHMVLIAFSIFNTT